MSLEDLILRKNEDENKKISSLHQGIYMISNSKFKEISSKYKDDLDLIKIGEFAFIHFQSNVDFKRNQVKWVLYLNIENLLNEFNSINNLATSVMYYILYAEILSSIDFEAFNLNRNKHVKEYLIYEKFQTLLPEISKELNELVLNYDNLEHFYPRFYSGNSLLSEINKLSKYLNKFEGLNFPIILKKHSFFESNKILREFVGSNEEFSNEFIDSLAQQLKNIEEFKLLKLSKSKEDNYENLS